MNNSKDFNVMLSDIKTLIKEAKNSPAQAQLSGIIFILSNGDKSKYEAMISILSNDFMLN